MKRMYFEVNFKRGKGSFTCNQLQTNCIGRDLLQCCNILNLLHKSMANDYTNRSLLIARNSLCPCCKGANISPEHIFLFCPTTTGIIYPNPLTEVLTPSYNIIPKTIITMWAQWKTFNWMMYHPNMGHNFSPSKQFRLFFSEEIIRFSNQYPELQNSLPPPYSIYPF